MQKCRGTSKSGKQLYKWKNGKCYTKAQITAMNKLLQNNKNRKRKEPKKTKGSSKKNKQPMSSVSLRRFYKFRWTS